MRLTKNLGNETRKFLNWLDIMLFHYEGSIRELQSTLVYNGLADLRANWNTWWDGEKRRGKRK